MLRLTNKFHLKGNIVVLDSGLGVLQGLMHINKGLYGAALINKGRYCLLYIGVENIKANFNKNSAGTVNALCGDIENMNLHVFSVK